MPDFLPILVAAVIIFIVLLLAFNTDFAFTYDGTSSGSLPPDRTIDFNDFIVYYTASEVEAGFTDGTVSNGVFGGETKRIGFQVENPGEVTEAIIDLNISDTNYYGRIMILVNGNEVYADYPLVGEKLISFDRSILKENNVLEIIAETSGWRIWAPTVYKFDAKVVLNYVGRKSMRFTFDVNEKEKDYLDKARIVVFGNRTGIGGLNIMVNGVKIYSGVTTVYKDFATSVLRTGNNTIDFSTEPNTRYEISSAQVVLFFE